jgi:methionyl-tRNA formyltransferase
MRLAFMGSPEFSVPALHALASHGHHIAAVYCQKPRPAGRGQAVAKCAVHQAAEAMGVPVFTPEKLRNDPAAQADFASLALDAAVVAAYGLILPQAMLDAPARGCLNIHASLLPRWRGASPIQSAILAGDAVSGVTIMRMEQGLDTGPMLLRGAVPIGAGTTAPQLHDSLAALGARLIIEALDADPTPVPQPAEGVSYAPKLSRADGRLDWASDSAVLDRRVRAFTPWPGTFTDFAGAPLKVLEATPEPGEGAAGSILDADFLVACGAGALRLRRVQRPGRPPTRWSAFLRGVAGSREHWPMLQ